MFHALGCGGNGVSFSVHAGHDDEMFDLLIYDSPLPFPAQGEWAAPFRRFGQSLMDRWHQLRDEVL